MTQDALVLGHIDVVKAADGMFAPKIERRQNVRARNIGYEVFCRGGDEFTHYVLEQKPAVKFGVILFWTKNKAAKARTRLWRAIRAERRRSA